MVWEFHYKNALAWNFIEFQNTIYWSNISGYTKKCVIDVENSLAI